VTLLTKLTPATKLRRAASSSTISGRQNDFGRISHQVRRLFSFLNFSDRFEKKPAQGDDRFVARFRRGK
jgi:hypothetical protein